MKTKKKIIKKSTVKNRLDKKWSLKIRGKGLCEVCGKTDFEGQLHPHHVIGRQDLRTRWDLRNGVCLCAGHHTMFKESAHGNPLWFMAWMSGNRLEDLDYLKEKMKEIPHPYSVQDYLEIEKELDCA